MTTIRDLDPASVSLYVGRLRALQEETGMIKDIDIENGLDSRVRDADDSLRLLDLTYNREKGIIESLK